MHFAAFNVLFEKKSDVYDKAQMEYTKIILKDPVWNPLSCISVQLCEPLNIQWNRIKHQAHLSPITFPKSSGDPKVEKVLSLRYVTEMTEYINHNSFYIT